MNFALERITQNNDWISYILLFALVILVVVKLMFSERLQLSLQLLFSKKYVLVFGREKILVFNGFNVLMIIFQLIIFSFLAYFLLKNYFNVFYQNKEYSLFGLIVIILFLSYATKYLLDKFIFKLFNNDKLHEKITFLNSSYLNIVALLLFPLILLFVYSPFFNEYILIFTLFLAFILMCLKLFLMINNNKSIIVKNLFYFILYLCALEIAPIIIILKLILKDLKAGL